MARKRQNFPFNVEGFYERIKAAEKGALDQVAIDIVQRARAKAPVRKIYEDKRPRSRAASPELVAAAVRAVQNNRSLSQRQRTEALYLLQHRPQEARITRRRQGSINTNQLRSLSKINEAALSARGRYELRTQRAFSDVTGEAPTRKTEPGEITIGGRLKRSIIQSKITREGGRLTIRVGPTVPYALFVEFPTRHNAAQPFLLPALKEAQQLFVPFLKDEMRARGIKTKG